MTFSTLGIKASSRTGAKGICVLGGVTLIIGLSKLQKPFSALKKKSLKQWMRTVHLLAKYTS